MSSNKFSNPWMPASNGVFGGGGAYNKNAYSVRGKGAANNPWVQGSGWWEYSVEGNYQKGFGQASHSNEYYSTEPVSRHFLEVAGQQRVLRQLLEEPQLRVEVQPQEGEVYLQEALLPEPASRQHRQLQLSVV